MLAPAFHHSVKEIPVLKTIASQNEGVKELYTIISGWEDDKNKMQQLELITEKVLSIILNKRMKGINREELKKELAEVVSETGFNLYRFAEKYY